jgi:hypothetical protein
MFGSSGNAYSTNNQQTAPLHSHPPAPVYVNAPPKPRRVSTQLPTQIMVTGQYHQHALTDVQKAHQRTIHDGQAPLYQAQHHQIPARRHMTSNSGAATFDPNSHVNGLQYGSIGRRSGANYEKQNGATFYGSVGRHAGTVIAPPRTPMMGRQVRARRHQLQPTRPKSSIEQRTESFYRDWPQQPQQDFSRHDQDFSRLDQDIQRDPRLFPIRTPQPPRRPTNSHGGSQYNLSNDPEMSQYFHDQLSNTAELHRSASARLHQNQNKTSHDPKRSLDETRRKDQRDESMKRLLEWKQRMLQSPLTRKSSRAQTPTNSDYSPMPSMISQVDQQSRISKLANGGSKVSRKGSGSSRTSRTRSISRLSNNFTSSSDEGKTRSY